MLSEVRHRSVINASKEKILWYHDVVLLRVSDLQNSRKRATNNNKARHVAEIHFEYGQCAGASFDRAYQIRLNSRGTHLKNFFFFSNRKMNTLTCFVVDLLKMSLKM